MNRTSYTESYKCLKNYKFFATFFSTYYLLGNKSQIKFLDTSISVKGQKRKLRIQKCQKSLRVILFIVIVIGRWDYLQWQFITRGTRVSRASERWSRRRCINSSREVLIKYCIKKSTPFVPRRPVLLDHRRLLCERPQ